MSYYYLHWTKPHPPKKYACRSAETCAST